ncbi:hypothetical protein B0H16DRAFT_1465747 [Mycena metata]|uniref:Uncharacterized protein n=1 Tax=Mycena metata TaxID=1033252 RepID=A0AAD7IAG5_9AGAR|nr:hypothetical protein B0H16DRAFT_1465747 [Mycena metata]
MRVAGQNAGFKPDKILGFDPIGRPSLKKILNFEGRGTPKLPFSNALRQPGLGPNRTKIAQPWQKLSGQNWQIEDFWDLASKGINRGPVLTNLECEENDANIIRLMRLG